MLASEMMVDSKDALVYIETIKKDQDDDVTNDENVSQVGPNQEGL